jgi:CBS domain-containing protein
VRNRQETDRERAHALAGATPGTPAGREWTFNYQGFVFADVAMETENVPAAQLMTSEVVSVTPDTPVTEAVDALLGEGIGSLVVLDEDGNLVGVVTSTDFLEIIGENDLGGEATVDQYMTEEVVTAGPQDSIRVVAARMITNDIKHLPVEDPQDGVVGMLSTTDVTAYSVSHV